MHRECYELSNCHDGYMNKPSLVWPFIAGVSQDQEPRLTEARKKGYQNKIRESEGRANPNGFSSELIALSHRIWELGCQKADEYELYREVLGYSRYEWLNKALSPFIFGDRLDALLIAQLFPPGQFLDENGRELKQFRPRKKTISGNRRYKRVGFHRFHAALGKAKFQRSSGSQTGSLVRGGDLIRQKLFLWSNRVIAKRNVKPTPQIAQIRKHFDLDVGLYIPVIEELKSCKNDDLKEFKANIRNIQKGSNLERITAIICELIDDSLKYKKKLSKGKITKTLGNWAKSRACDLVVKLLWHEYKACYRQSLTN